MGKQTLDEFLDAVVASLPSAPVSFSAIPDAQPYEAQGTARDYAKALLTERLGFADAPERAEQVAYIRDRMTHQVFDFNRPALNRGEIEDYAEAVIATAEQAVEKHLSGQQRSSQWQGRVTAADASLAR